MKNLISQDEKNRIDSICKKYNISNHTINPDGSIDVDGNVNLGRTNLTQLPLIFNKVNGWFDCRMNNLTTLAGSPIHVTEAFICSDNSLTSLMGCPEYVGGDFSCGYNPLMSLEYSPKFVGDKFACSGKLTSIHGLPVLANGRDYLISTNGLPIVLSAFLFDHNEEDINSERIIIFAKYQAHYNVWTPEFNQEGFEELRDDIDDGLL